MPELAGIIFYVGKGTKLSRMNVHFREAASEKCDCAKCEAIQSVWAIGLAVVRNTVFTSINEKAALQEEARRIVLHYSPYLTNVKLPKKLTSRNKRPAKSSEPNFSESEILLPRDYGTRITREEVCELVEKNNLGKGTWISTPLISQWAMEEDEIAYFDLATGKIVLEMGGYLGKEEQNMSEEEQEAFELWAQGIPSKNT